MPGTNPRSSRMLAFAEILSVGFPFCVFKVLTGLVMLRLPVVRPVGYALIALGVVDAVLNLLGLVALVTRRPVPGVCLIDVVVRHLRRHAPNRQDLGLALDVLLSFCLVAAVIGLGQLRYLPDAGLTAWSTAVVFNVLGAGISRMLTALQG